MVTQEVELPIAPPALLRRCVGEPFVCALDGGGPASWGCGRALLGFRPRATLRIDAAGAALVRADGVETRWDGDPFELLDRFCAQWGPSDDASTEPFAGGVIAALNYDLRHWVERLPQRAPDDLGLPVLHAAAYDWLLSYAYARRRYRLASARGSAAMLREVGARLQALARAAEPPSAAIPARQVVADCTQAEYRTAVERALEYIAAGDIYQVNLAQRFRLASPAATSRPDLGALFATLQRLNTMPFAAYVDAGDCVLVSNSPECLLHLQGRAAATFPIKGTRPRGLDAASDRALAAALRADPKERAEHVMIVDLERNDLGRICRTGTVRVEDFARVQTFPSLHHMVSKVAGELRPEVTLAETLRAMFPGGSITGAPKIRAMEIIDAIEPVSRGFYTGAIGCIGAGTAVFNIAIRTVVGTGRQLSYHAGGGIVADSDPGREYDETLLKAAPFFQAARAWAA